MDTNDNELELYAQLILYRIVLKQIQQLSWNINQLEQKYPSEKIRPQDYETMANLYKQLCLQVYQVVDSYEKMRETGSLT
jgi:hypothetical protein